MTSPLSTDQESASAVIKAALASWGLTELYDTVDDLIKDGLGDDAITVRLQSSEAYKKRFAANDARQAKGLAVLSPAEYLAAEASYRRVLASYGLPSGFYDQTSDFADFIANDVSPDEVNQRAQAAQQAFLTADPGVRQAWQDLYGLSDGAGIAALLDESKAMPIINRMSTAATAAAAAARNGLGYDKGRLESYADRGITGQQLTDAFGQIGATFGADSAIAQRFGQTFTQADAEAATIEGTASARRKQLELRNAEAALFQAKPGADRNSLSRRTSGSY